MRKRGPAAGLCHLIQKRSWYSGLLSPCDGHRGRDHRFSPLQRYWSARSVRCPRRLPHCIHLATNRRTQPIGTHQSPGTFGNFGFWASFEPDGCRRLVSEE